MVNHINDDELNIITKRKTREADVLLIITIHQSSRARVREESHKKFRTTTSTTAVEKIVR